MPKQQIPERAVELDDNGRILGTAENMNCGFQSFPNFIPKDEPLWPTLLHDCEVAHQHKSFWLPSQMQPRSMLERVAKAIFTFHTKVFDVFLLARVTRKKPTGVSSP